MKKQTVLIVLSFIAVVLLLPAGVFAQGAETPTPFDDESVLPTGGEEETADTGEGYSEDTGEDFEEDTAEKRREMELPLEKKAKVVEKKLYPKKFKHELNLYFGLNPADSFVFSLVEGARYNFHIHEMLALQGVFGYMQSFDRDSTKLLTDPVDKGGQAIDESFIKNAEVDWFTNLDFVFYPVYGKFSLLASVIAHYDAGIYVGGGVMSLANGDYAPAPDLGLVSNFYINKWLSLRGDFMYYALITEDKRPLQTGRGGSEIGGGTTTGAEEGKERGGTLLRNNYFFTFGVSFHLPVD